MMAKSRSAKDSEDLRGENRNLRKEIKHLRREVARLSKNISKTENMVDNFAYNIEDVFEETTVTTTKNLCKSCNKGKLKTIDLGIRKLLICDECRQREIIK